MAGLGLSTVVDFERGRRVVSKKAIAAICAALESAVEFIPENGGGAGVRLGAYSFRSARASIGGKPDEVESVVHFVRKEDAIEAARSRLQAELKCGTVIFNPRLGFWWPSVDGKPPRQTFELRGPLGNAIVELNMELGIQEEQE